MFKKILHGVAMWFLLVSLFVACAFAFFGGIDALLDRELGFALTIFMLSLFIGLIVGTLLYVVPIMLTSSQEQAFVKETGLQPLLAVDTSIELSKHNYSGYIFMTEDSFHVRTRKLAGCYKFQLDVPYSDITKLELDKNANWFCISLLSGEEYWFNCVQRLEVLDLYRELTHSEVAQ